jgi:hypothetical protein
MSVVTGQELPVGSELHADVSVIHSQTLILCYHDRRDAGKVLLFASAWHCGNLRHIIISISVVIATQTTQPTMIQAQHRYSSKVPIIFQPHICFS